MLLTDTYSLMYKIEAENVYEEFYKDKELFDFSNYPKDLKYYNNPNKLVVSKMKDETYSVPIKGFVGLKSKMCTFIKEDNHESKKAKGINNNVVDDELKYEDYKNVLFNRSYTRHEMNGIQIKDHNIGSYRINEISLSSYNYKKYMLKDGYSRFLHFHKFAH